MNLQSDLRRYIFRTGLVNTRASHRTHFFTLFFRALIWLCIYKRSYPISDDASPCILCSVFNFKGTTRGDKNFSVVDMMIR